MTVSLLLMAGLVPVVLAALKRRSRSTAPVGPDPAGWQTPISRQHVHLYQGGRINPTALEAAKAELKPLLDQGAVGHVAALLRPGEAFVVRVRALADLGGDVAAEALERVLATPLGGDPIEQAWYQVDVAGGLRLMGRWQSLPVLLRAFPSVSGSPLGHLFAAELVTFPGFLRHLRKPKSELGRLAARVLHRTLEGLRTGLAPQFFGEAGLGEAVVALWEHKPAGFDPLVVRVLVEARRQLDRAHHTEARFLGETAERRTFRGQVRYLRLRESAFNAYLARSAPRLALTLRLAPPEEQKDLLLALLDLRSESASAVLPRLDDPEFHYPDLALEVLAWSRDAHVGKVLVERASAALTGRRRWWGGTAHERLPLPALLRALRGHPSAEAEAVLVRAARIGTPEERTAAVAALGWWEPVDRIGVRGCLRRASQDRGAALRRAARAALARLGERQSLHWFRQTLAADSAARVTGSVRLVAEEGLTWLWPDLDQLADAEDVEVAFHAREALGRLREEVFARR